MRTSLRERDAGKRTFSTHSAAASRLECVPGEVGEPVVLAPDSAVKAHSGCHLTQGVILMLTLGPPAVGPRRVASAELPAPSSMAPWHEAAPGQGRTWGSAGEAAAWSCPTSRGARPSRTPGGRHAQSRRGWTIALLQRHAFRVDGWLRRRHQGHGHARHNIRRSRVLWAPWPFGPTAPVAADLAQ